MEQRPIITTRTDSYSGFDQDMQIEAENLYDVSKGLDDFADIPSIILPGKHYRVVAGQLYVVHPGSPPTLLP